MADPADRRRWTMKVTQEDIDKAHINDSYKCVVAQAIARTIPDATKIEVDLQTIRFSRNGERLTYLTPYTVAGYIVAFDGGDEIQPFDFHLRSPIVKPSRTRTPVGLDIKRRRSRIRDLQQREKAALTVIADPAARPPAKAKAQAVINESPDLIAQAQAVYQQAAQEAKAAGVPLEQDRGRRPPPKVYKTKTRMYGQRVLRVNQAEGRKHYAG